MKIDDIVNPSTLPYIGSAVGAVLLFVLRKWKKDSALTWESLFQEGVEVAYHMVNDVAKTTASPIDDKVALCLGFLNEYLKANGKAPAVGADLDRAKMLFKAMHGEAG